MLSDNEWELLDQLIILLMPFEEETRKFSGRTYVTLSRMIPAIKKLIFDLADDLSLTINDPLFENTDELIDILPIETDSEEVISNFTKKKISIKNSLDTFGIFDKIRDSIYSALIFY